MFLKIVQVKQFICHALYPSLCFSSTAFVSTFSPVDKPVDDTDICPFQLPVRTHYYARILYNLFSRSSFGTKDIDAVYHRKHGWETAVIHRWIIRWICMHCSRSWSWNFVSLRTLSFRFRWFTAILVRPYCSPFPRVFWCWW